MNLQKLMKQAQQMQASMAAAQQQLAAESFETLGAGGKIKVTVNGQADLLSLHIDPSLLDPEDAEFVSDLLLKTIQEALNSAKKKQEALLSQATGGLGGMGSFPGL